MAKQTLFDDKFNALFEIGEHFLLSPQHTKNQVACAIHNYNHSQSRNPIGRQFSYKQIDSGFRVILVDIKNPVSQ